MNNANSITIDLAWYKILSEFSETLRRRVFDAIFTYAATGKRPSFKGQAKLAFEFIAHEISKQITVPEPTDPVPSDNSELYDKSESSEDPVDRYYSMYRAPEPFSYDGAYKPRELTAERIRSLVEIAAKNIVDKGELTPLCPEFYIKLNQIVNARYRYICNRIRDFDPHKTLEETDWATIFDKAYWVAKP